MQELAKLYEQFEIPSPHAGKAPSQLTINPFWEKIKQLPGDKFHMEFYGKWNPRIFSADHMVRDDFCREYAWAITDPTSVQFVADWLKPRAVELGAGRGYWAWQVAQLGVDILAYDIAPPDKVFTNHYHSPRAEAKETRFGDFLNQPVTCYHPVAQGDESVLLQHTDRTLFLCWPPYDSDMAMNALNSYTGKRLVYIGEGSGGCTADDAFHDRLEEDWEEVASHEPVQWDGIHDWIYVYERKSS